MPSLDHEAILDLFRSEPRLVAEVMRAAFDLRLPEGAGRTIESVLGEVVPTEYRADLVVALGEARVIVEVQLSKSAEKRWSWPNYVTTLRAREKCPVYLLVVTNSVEVARWAREPIPLGTPGSSFLPFVLGPDSCPRIATVEVARKYPELAVLSGLLHGTKGEDVEGLAAALAGAMALEGNRATLYGDLVLRMAGAVARQVLEAHMSILQGYEFQSEFARKYWSEGREEGREQGREEGRISTLSEAVLKVLTSRGLEPSEAERAAILGSSDPQTLERWLIQAVTANSVEELLRVDPSGLPQR